ncbi:beta-ketoacyl-ACP synthase 3 [Spirillospora albida]|uniref:beta-ketoacyl-ACP synthase 3 n=1 Tax=Spirillospora albida TaxID=58123 RepID=UPI0004BF491D|nr:beta-ketoacyl-ACP synthase 3 [Spirillospora albida]
MNGARMAGAAVIQSIGHYIPAGRQTNDDLARVLDTDDEWVRTRTGIRARAKAADGEPTSTLASHAGKAALAGAGLTEVDTVVVATTTPDMKCPATAPLVADGLGLTGATAFDVNSACVGFLAGLSIASGLITTGNARGVLLIGAEHFSSMVHGGDRATAPIFGDGAAAVVVRPGDADEPGAIGRVHLATDGALRDLAHVKAGGSGRPTTPDTDPRDLYLRMDGRATYRHAVAKMVGSCERTLRDRGMTSDDVDLLVAHQANARILREVARRLGVPADRALVDLTDIGNTGAASIPIALSRAHHGGGLNGGETLLLTGFGAGASWGSTVLRWPALPPGSDPSHPPA